MNDLQVQKDIRSAIKASDVEKVTELIGSDTGRLNMQTPFGTWLHVAASKGALAIVRKLIELGADVNRLGGVYGGGALNEAASAGKVEIVKYLLSCGAELDVSSPVRNPLFGAISNGHFDVAKVLIDSGIDTEVKYNGESMNDMDAVNFAKEFGQTRIVEMLQNRTAEPDSGKKHRHEENDNVLEHITTHFGPAETTLNEILPGSRVAICIHVIPPSPHNPFITLATTGMSDQPMDYSNEEGMYKYAELVLKLPSTWTLNQQWPLSWLRQVAHIPHLYDGWVEEGTILPNGEPPRPFASNTRLSSILLVSPQEEGLGTLHTNGKNVQFQTLIPIYEEERNLALKHGARYLIDILREEGVSDVLNISRPNVAVNKHL